MEKFMLAVDLIRKYVCQYGLYTMHKHDIFITHKSAFFILTIPKYISYYIVSI